MKTKIVFLKTINNLTHYGIMGNCIGQHKYKKVQSNNNIDINDFDYCNTKSVIKLDNTLSKYENYSKIFPKTFKKHEKYISAFTIDELNKIVEVLEVMEICYIDNNNTNIYVTEPHDMYVFTILYNKREALYKNRALTEPNNTTYIRLEGITIMFVNQSDPPSYEYEIKFEGFPSYIN